jgi:hypothetical protein
VDGSTLSRVGRETHALICIHSLQALFLLSNGVYLQDWHDGLGCLAPCWTDFMFAVSIGCEGALACGERCHVEWGVEGRRARMEGESWRYIHFEDSWLLLAWSVRPHC